MNWKLWVTVCVMAAGCSRPSPAPAESPEERPVLSVTRWTDRTELFAEYPSLVTGATSRFAVHLTRLDTFKALTAGRVEVRLEGDGPAESFSVDAPSRPGIFGVDVRPAHAGNRELVVIVRGPGVDDEHRVGAVVVHRDEAAARAATVGDDEEAEGISFLKEQQWTLEFATAVALQAPARESLRVPGHVVPRAGGSADVAAPFDGRLVFVADLQAGAVVSQGDELVRLQPPPTAPAELPLLQQARAEAAAALDAARRDRERAERLVTAGAAAARRVDDARAVEAQAEARMTGAAARLEAYQAARTGATAAGDPGFVVRAPIAGTVAERIATTGANVTTGTVLFRVVDTRRLLVAGQVPEASLSRARQSTEAELELPGQSARVRLDQRIGIGRVLDPRTRTVPITFALDRNEHDVAVGQSVFLHLLLAETAARPVVPVAAIVDDGGRPVVFVQTGGEAFERRPVTLGARTGGVVQVVEGVAAGDRVVTTGAYLLRLASLSTQAPAHGHVH